MKVHKYKYNPEKKGVFRVSVVKHPAVGEGDLVLMAAQEIKGVFYAPVMIPDLKIQRIDQNTGEKYLVYYDSETVEQLANNYFKNNGNSETNIEHSQELLEGVYPVESWIVADPTTDKSKALGMPSQKQGTWIMGYKCENEEVLEKVKNQLLQGLSIEGQLDMEEDLDSPISKFSKQKSMFEKIKEQLNGIITFMNSDVKEEEEVKEPLEEKEKPVEEMAEEVVPAAEESKEPTELEAALSKIQDLEKKIADMEAEKAKDANDATLMAAQVEDVKKAFENYKAVNMSSQKIADLPVVENKNNVSSKVAEMRANRI